MPRIVPYDEVLATAERLDLRCTYPNGGAFLLSAEPQHVACWSATRDESVKPRLRERLCDVPVERLAGLIRRAWQELASDGGLDARAMWLLPVHHWAAELEHGRDEAGQDITQLLADAGVADGEIARLRSVTRADAIEFASAESGRAESLVGALLEHMWKSDFTLLFPPARVAGMLHHHRQVWWQCADAATADRLLELGRQVSNG